MPGEYPPAGRPPVHNGAHPDPTSSRVEVAAQALHLACALPGVTYACGLGGFARLPDARFDGLEVIDGGLRVPEGP